MKFDKKASSKEEEGYVDKKQGLWPEWESGPVTGNNEITRD